MKLSSTTPLYTVIAVVRSADGAVLETMFRHARAGLDIFGGLDGFIGGALHRAHDAASFVQYLQWRDEGCYRAAIDDPIWDTVATTPQFMEALDEGLAELSVSAYSVVAVVGPAPAQ